MSLFGAVGAIRGSAGGGEGLNVFQRVNGRAGGATGAGSAVGGATGAGRVDLFHPLTVRGVTFKNRIGISPMCQYNAHDGFPGDYHLAHLGARALGGAGLIIVEATGVEARGRISLGCTGIWKDDHIPAWKRITDFTKQYTAIGIQLAHAGRKASATRPWEGDRSLTKEEGGWETVSSFSTPHGSTLTHVPKALDDEGIEEVKRSWVQAAVRAQKAGFQLIELHFAHGYLAHQFYSPLSNKRTDRYGGSFENRVRLLVEIAEGVRKVWPAEYPLAARISCTDYLPGGWTIEDSVKLAVLLKSVGVDIIDCSSGGISPDRSVIPVGPSYQVSFAEKIKKEAGILTAAVGLLTEPRQLNSVIESNQADLTLIARASLNDPNFPYHAAIALGKDISFIKQHNILTPLYALSLQRFS